MSTRKQVAGIVTTGIILSTLGIFAYAQNDTTNTSISVQGGSLSLYAGDSVDDNDICSAADITAGNTVETITCDTTQNSIALPSIFIQNNRQNPSTILNDVIVEDLSGASTSDYTVTAEVSNFVGTSNTITLGSNPDGASGLDTGTVTAVAMTEVGAGYSNDVDVTISAPASGTQATAIPVISGGTVSAINITNPGSGYTSSDTVTVTIVDNTNTPTTNATATAELIYANDNLSTGVVDSITVTAGGTGYTTAPTVTISAPATGTAATATAVLTADAVTQIIVTNPGSGYDSGDTVTVTITGDGTGATATANLTLEGDPQNNVFVTLDPSIGTLDWLAPTGGDMSDFATGNRVLVTNTTTQYTLFNTTTATSTGRFEIDGVEFGLRVPAFVAADSYDATITQTVIN